MAAPGTQLEKRAPTGDGGPLQTGAAAVWMRTRLGWAAMAPQQRRWTVATAALLSTLLGGLLWYGLRTDWRTLYAGLEPDDARQVGLTLTQAQIPYDVADNGTTLRVPAAQLISGSNITTSGSVIQDPVASATATGSLTFDSNGNLVSPSTNVSGITFSGLSDGASNLNMTWNLFGTDGSSTLSQVVAQTSAASSSIQDGFASGNYSGFTIGSDGTVTATFNNGQKLNVGQLALGNVVNLQGLQDTGNGDYATTLASGTATIGVSGTSGLGSMQGGALEASNVNISAEFSDLIIAQRAFEANSKAVTTFDTITQETINMIH